MPGQSGSDTWKAEPESPRGQEILGFGGLPFSSGAFCRQYVLLLQPREIPTALSVKQGAPQPGRQGRGGALLADQRRDLADCS